MGITRPQKSANATNPIRWSFFPCWRAGKKNSILWVLFSHQGDQTGGGGNDGALAGPCNLELKVQGPGKIGYSHSARQPSIGWEQQMVGPFFLLQTPPLFPPLPIPEICWALAGEVRLDEVELSGNEAVLGGEMRLSWKINEVVLSGNEVVLGGKVRLHY